MTEASTWIKINRTPVLTLWAAVVAERLGFDRPTALTLGQAVAGLNAYAKGVSLGIIEPRPSWSGSAATSSPRVSAFMWTCSGVRCRWSGRTTGCGP
jgi:hypothetical protein